MARSGLGSLRSLGGGSAESQRMAAAFELGRRALLAPISQGPIRDPEEACACVAPELVGQERERFVVVALDVRNRPRCVAAVGDGGVDPCPVDLREVFVHAVRERGSAVIVAHNHPSGDADPPELLRQLGRARFVGGVGQRNAARRTMYVPVGSFIAPKSGLLHTPRRFQRCQRGRSRLNNSL